MVNIPNLTEANALLLLEPYSSDNDNTNAHLFLDIADNYTLKGIFFDSTVLPSEKKVVAIGVSSAILATIVKTDLTVQTLNDGDNQIIHSLNKNIIGFFVKDGNDFIDVTGAVINTNRFNINLAGGGPIVNADIYLNYL